MQLSHKYTSHSLLNPNSRNPSPPSASSCLRSRPALASSSSDPVHSPLGLRRPLPLSRGAARSLSTTAGPAPSARLPLPLHAAAPSPHQARVRARASSAGSLPPTAPQICPPQGSGGVEGDGGDEERERSGSQILEKQVLSAAKAVEDKLDEEVAALDCFDPDGIEALRERRIQQTTGPARFGTPLSLITVDWLGPDADLVVNCVLLGIVFPHLLIDLGARELNSFSLCDKLCSVGARF